MSSKNLSRSMLRPETTATIGPLPALPLKAAATDSAPAPHCSFRLERFERATDSGEQTTTSNRRGYRHHIGRVLENLQSERRIPGHKILVVERVNECSFDSREGAILHCLPGSIERDWN